MNEIYKDYWNPLQNFFIPNFKLEEKYRIGSKIKKKYSTPKTPYKRLIESSHLTKEQKDTLIDQKKKLNPYVLKKGLEEKLSLFYKQLKQNKIRAIAL